MLYKAQIRPSLEYFSHIWGAAAPTTLSIHDAVQRRAIRLIGDPALSCHIQPLSHRRAFGDLSLFYRYSNGFYSFELTSIILPLSKSARCTRETSSSHPRAAALHKLRTKPYDHNLVPRASRAWNGLPGDVLVEPASVGLFKSRVNKLPLNKKYFNKYLHFISENNCFDSVFIKRMILNLNYLRYLYYKE
nr:unnamed protein product [Callosobruchus chinensis]